ncbi:DUF3085 domain-containing protein [Hyphomicrobium sp. MC8b]|uniref:DUF3085 domain-containing protein n=1 Tax=Hyphomicrobium sp. MC8b TaxID=300273 RepID=UPI003919ADF6
MDLHFNWTALQRAFEELDTAQTARPLYDRDTGKGLWLVGDHGVYLMPNTVDGCHHASAGGRVVVYADECNPSALDFDTWWTNKRASFGGDDGCEFIDIAPIRALAANPPKPRFAVAHLIIALSPADLALSLAWHPPARS